MLIGVTETILLCRLVRSARILSVFFFFAGLHVLREIRQRRAGFVRHVLGKQCTRTTQEPPSLGGSPSFRVACLCSKVCLLVFFSRRDRSQNIANHLCTCISNVSLYGAAWWRHQLFSYLFKHFITIYDYYYYVQLPLPNSSVFFYTCTSVRIQSFQTCIYVDIYNIVIFLHWSNRA